MLRIKGMATGGHCIARCGSATAQNVACNACALCVGRAINLVFMTVSSLVITFKKKKTSITWKTMRKLGDESGGQRKVPRERGRAFMGICLSCCGHNGERVEST